MASRGAVLVLAMALGSTLMMPGCTSPAPDVAASLDERAARDPVLDRRARAAIFGFVDLGHKSYDAALLQGKFLEKAIEDFNKAPSQELLDAARVQWAATRRAFLLTEPYRIEGDLFDKQPQLARDLWTLPVRLEGIEGVDGRGGLVGDVTRLPDVNEGAVEQLARQEGIPLGLQAVAAILWGLGAEPRPLSDFVDAADASVPYGFRRTRFAAKLMRTWLLSIELLVNDWERRREGSTAARLLAGSLDVGYAKIFAALRRYATRGSLEDLVANLEGKRLGAGERGFASRDTAVDRFDAQGLAFCGCGALALGIGGEALERVLESYAEQETRAVQKQLDEQRFQVQRLSDPLTTGDGSAYAARGGALADALVALDRRFRGGAPMEPGAP